MEFEFITDELWEMSLEGCDDEFGSVSEPPFVWYGLLTQVGNPHTSYIITTDYQGFRDVVGEFDTAEAAREYFDALRYEVEYDMENAE